MPVRLRTQLINALRGHLAAFGLVVPKGSALKLLESALADETGAPRLLLADCVEKPRLLRGLIADSILAEAGGGRRG